MSKSKNMHPSIEDAKQLRMSLQEILLATSKFAQKNLIGRGGFGIVYQGMSDKHGRIAVKRLDRSSGQGEVQFKAEIGLLSKSKHENIVSLVGFCDENGEQILVYKYESNGSLDNHLNNENLTWIQRIQICLDVARGLEYAASELKVYHRDVKSPNILLDDKWKAKISDFGLSRVASQSSFVNSFPCGTRGYVDPYYYMNGILSQNTDVFSFGVVLFEVLCGRLAQNSKYKNKDLCFYLFVKQHYEKGTLLKEIVPSYLHSQINPDSFNTFTKIAYQCLKDREDRPTMKQVVEQLQKALHNQQCAYHEDPPLQEVVLKVLLDCDGCVSKVHKCLKKLNDVENVNVDRETQKVVVKGTITEPLKIAKIVNNKINREVEILWTVPKLPKQQDSPKQENKKDELAVKKPEEGKKLEKEVKPTTIYEKKGKKSKDLPPPPAPEEVVLKVTLDCKGCAKKVYKCLKDLKGVGKVFTNSETHKVIVKGKIADPLKVAEIVHKMINREVEIL